jgi:FkbM family methyltransferase
MPVAAADAARGSPNSASHRTRRCLGQSCPAFISSSKANVTVLTVTQATLDQIASDAGLVPDLIKIDVEGSLMLAPKGARNLLATRKPRIVFESFPGPLDGTCSYFSLTMDIGCEPWHCAEM